LRIFTLSRRVENASRKILNKNAYSVVRIWMTTQRQRKTAATLYSSLKELRKFLGLTQKEMAIHGSCSPAMIQSAEIGRKPLSVAIAFKVSESTGIDFAWLMSDDPRAPMITSAGEEYTISEFERRQTNRVAPGATHYRWRELQIGLALDFLYRLLGANRLKGKEAVHGYMQRLEGFIKSELKRLPMLEDRVFGEIRRAKEAAAFTGRIRALQFLTPFDMKPLQRGREKLGQSIAAFTSRQTRQARRQTGRVKSDK
jgi:transcriptional regulator with XRE-family HTH domain